MGGYANSGDADNGTFIDPSTRLGGDGGPYGLSNTQIVVIVLVIAFAISILFSFLYYRKLEARRRFDLERNQVIELRGGAKPGDRGGSSSSNMTFGPPMGSTRPATPVQLMTAPEENPFGNPETSAQGISKPEPAIVATDKGAPACGGPSAGQKKPPLWKYIHWKEGPPKKQKPILPQAEPNQGRV